MTAANLPELTESDLQFVRRPPLQAKTLPPRCYWDQDFYERELHTLFAKEWICVGRVEDIVNPGDYFTRTIGSEPLIIVRGASGEVFAHLNVCRHRGCQVAEGHGTVKTFKCPYHGWMYSLDGTLRAAPEFKETIDFRKGDYPLHSVAVEIWEGFIFVNFDEAADSLASRVTEATKWGVDKYRMGELVTTHRWEFELKCNWKTYVENFIEAYHVPWVHPNSFQAVGPMKGWIDLPDISDQPWAIMIGQFPDLSFSDAGTAVFPVRPELKALPREYQGMGIWLVFPTFMCIPAIDCMVYYVAFPDGPEDTTIMLALCLQPDIAERYKAGDARVEELAEQYARNTVGFILEDNRISQVQQRGLRARRATAGRFCKHERLAWKFQKWVVEHAYLGDFSDGAEHRN